MKGWLIAVGLAFGIASAPVGAADEPLTNDDIVRLTEVGIGPSVIVRMIESSPTAFDTSVGAVVALNEKGIEDEVLAAMVAAGQGPAARVGTSGEEPSGRVAPPAAGSASQAQPKAIPGSTFRESLRSGGEGPEMVVIPAGSFRMGCLSNDNDCEDDEKPVHRVTIPRAFAVSKYEVTFEDYDRFTHPDKVYDLGWGRGRRPAISVSWHDAKDYVEWLSSETGTQYRLLTEAEWEYAARAGSRTKYSWGNDMGTNRANCGLDLCGDRFKHTAPVGSFRPNVFGLYDMHGNVKEWVEDCWNGSYAGAPSDGSAWTSGECEYRVFRGGSILNVSQDLRSAYRGRGFASYQDVPRGFRVARTFTP